MTIPPPSASAPVAPAYSDATQKLIRRARIARDLFVVAIGIGLAVYYIAMPKPQFYGGRYGSSADSAVSEASLIIAPFLIVLFGGAAIAHYGTRTFKRKWTRKTRWTWSIIGLLLGGYLITAALAVNGYIGQRTDDADLAYKTNSCHYLTNQREHSDWVACDLTARWPDGTTSLVRAVPLDSKIESQTVTVVRPAFAPWPFPGDAHGFQLADLLALLAIGVPMAGQAVASILILIIGGSRRKRQRVTADLPPGELPV